LIPDPLDLLRRYCGQEWSGGAPEVWAYQYFDLIQREPMAPANEIDLLCCGALHPRLLREDLEFYSTRGFRMLDEWAASIPLEFRLEDADETIFLRLEELQTVIQPSPLALVTKMAHRLRPHLVPPYENTVGAFYRGTTGSRGEASWPRLVRAIAWDLRQNRAAIAEIQAELELRKGPLPAVRLVDIVIFMEEQRHKRESAPSVTRRR
jgi:Family of unknown function (DUF6308)